MPSAGKAGLFRPIGPWIADPKTGTLLGRRQIDRRHLADRQPGSANEKHTCLVVPGWVGVSALPGCGCVCGCVGGRMATCKWSGLLVSKSAWKSMDGGGGGDDGPKRWGHSECFSEHVCLIPHTHTLQVRTSEEVAWSPTYQGKYCPVLWDTSLAVKLRVVAAECETVEEAVRAGELLLLWAV